jgi:hypothetical protein
MRADHRAEFGNHGFLHFEDGKFGLDTFRNMRASMGHWHAGQPAEWGGVRSCG